jgi:hypothetical protein
LRPIEEQGYVCVAVNTSTIDYVDMARRLFESLRHWHPEARTCLITDQATEAPEFDHVKILAPQENPYANDPQAFRLTPFRETIKLEADMLIVSEIAHWWTMLRHRDVVVSVGCRDWHGLVSTQRHYRRMNDENKLPDVYNAITYWRLSETSQQFYQLVRDIFANWSAIKTLLKFPEDQPSTDVVYAIAAQTIGPDLVTMPFASYPQITHMRPRIAGTAGNWTRELVWEWVDGRLRIESVPQWGTFHYHVKDWQP